MSISEKEDLKGKPANMPTRNFDLFQSTPYITVGDPYLPPLELSKRDSDHKKNFAVGHPKESKFISLASSDSDAYAKDKPKEKEVVIKIPFKVSSPPKKPSGSGSTYGCFGPITFLPQGLPKKTNPKDLPPPKPNIRIQPAKKGYGNTPKILIGGKEYEYLSEGAFDDKQKQSTIKEKGKERSKSPTPFHVRRVGGLFDPNPFHEVKNTTSRGATGDGSIGGGSGDGKEGSTSSSSRSSGRSGLQNKVFRPSSPSKSGWQGTFTKYEYMSPGDGSSRSINTTGSGGDGSGSGEGGGDGKPGTSQDGTKRNVLHQPVFRPVGKSVFDSPQPSIAFHQSNNHRTFLQAHGQF